MKPVVLRVEDLHVHYPTPAGAVKAVTGVSFSLHEGERLGLVGESGSGKSTTALAIMRMLETAVIPRGRAVLGNDDLLHLSDEAMRRARFSRISLVPQGAMNSLNPVIRIREQIADIFDAHDERLSQKALDKKIGDLLQRVGLQAGVARMFPHELSGGMKQRVCIAMAIALRPQVIIADEPTSALDVVVQRQVMETLVKVQQELSAAVILVGHDMGLMAQFADTIGVMYAGRLVEIAPVSRIFRAPQHPYTQMLIASIPSIEHKRLFKGIPGVAPSLLNAPSGCPFHPRCPQVMPHCASLIPELLETQPGHHVSCHLYEKADTHATPS